MSAGFPRFFAAVNNYRKPSGKAKTKIALCQSKRLYPKSKSTQNTYPYRRKFRFEDSSKYKALRVKDVQYENIAEFERERRLTVYYVLYNPCMLPSEVDVPLDSTSIPPLENKVGARVIPSKSVRERLSEKEKNYSPSFSDIQDCVPETEGIDYEGNWRLEDFVGSLLIGCKVGDVAETEKEFFIRYQREWPITAAVEFFISVPEDDFLKILETDE